MAADTTETDLEAQPPWDLIALLVLAFVVLGWMALALSFSPGPGVQGAFERLHSVALQSYRTVPWRTFLTELPTHYGPLFYALVGGLGLSLEGMRAAGLVMHWVSTLLMLQLALRLGLAWQPAVLLTSSFFVSVFQLGAALWGHPETLSMLLWVLGLSVPVLAKGGARQASAWLLPLTVGGDPAGSARVASSCLDDLRRRLRSDPLTALQALICAIALACGASGCGLDLKALDAFFWPLLLMALIRRPDRHPALIRGALVWSAAGLLSRVAEAMA
ncbi:MAG: hypothetical protein QG612_2471 [Pseudomonadota bacterium]|nr:hypothetical protein [Pseudomonadota bacterium]